MPTHEHHLWTIGDVANYLLVSTAAVEQYIAEQGLPHIWLEGSMLLFRKSDIDAWLDTKVQSLPPDAGLAT